MSWRNVVPIYGITYSTAKSAVVNNNSIYDTETISGDLISEKKTNNNQKCLTWRFLRAEYMYSSAPNGLCPRHVARMLPTTNSEQQSTTRSRVYVVTRATQRGKKAKDRRETKIDSQRHCKRLTSGVEKACREKRRLRSEARLSVDAKCRMAEI